MIIPVEAFPSVYMSTIFLSVVWFFWSPTCERQRWQIRNPFPFSVDLACSDPSLGSWVFG